MILSHLLLYACLGLFAGLVAGLLGIGGGLVVVPGLVFLLQHQAAIPKEQLMQIAVGTSLAAMIITAQASVRAHHRQGNLQVALFYRLWPGLVLGTLMGALLASMIPTSWLKTFFACFLFFVAIRMLWAKPHPHAPHFPKLWLNHGINFLIGTNSGLLGVGGGILMVPYLNYCGVDLRKTAALANLSALCIALTGTLVYSLMGVIYWPAVFLIGVFSSLSAPLGAHLNYRLPVTYLNYAFILLLLLTAFKMLI